MQGTTTIRVAMALLIACGATRAIAQEWVADDSSVEVEVIHVRALSLVPASRSTHPALLLPRPHLPMHDEGKDGSAHVILGDIPFDAPAASDTPQGLWDRVRGSFALQEIPSPLVKDWENWYASRPEYVARMLARAERYLFYIVEEVEKRGMPSEIALLPMIESAYNPIAYSTAHASGIWQFIPATGKSYGLKQNWWQDERRDVLSATRAALDYLDKLYDMFGSWELALASYNWGEGAVGRAIQRNEARGLKTDYMSLEMPAETRNYIPKLMAVKNIIARPENYGLVLAPIENRPYFTVVTTDRHIDVKLAAQLAEMPVEDFQALNPSHNRPVIRADVAQPILLPADRAERYQANLDAHGSALTSWKSYTINRDDRLDRIAQRFGIAVSQLREINSIPARIGSLVGITILVPASAEHAAGDPAAAGFAAPAAVSKLAGSVAQHVVQAGETLAGIARRYRVSVGQLATRNGIRNGKILAGQSLAIGVAVPAAQSAQKPSTKRTGSATVARGNARRATPSKEHATKSSGKRTQVAYVKQR